MDKVIKFRGKGTKSNKWVYGGYYKHLKRTPSPIGDCIRNDDYQSLIINTGFSDWNMPTPINYYEVDEETVGQYTGLKDSNGVELYEGDIYHMGYKNIRYVVVWYDAGLAGKQIGSNSYTGISHWIDRIEILGNKHDNPELLNETDARAEDVMQEVTLGNNIKKLRLEMGMSRSKMSDKLNVSQSTLVKWERSESRPGLEMCCVLAGVFGVDLDTLIKGEV